MIKIVSRKFNLFAVLLIVTIISLVVPIVNAENMTSVPSARNVSAPPLPPLHFNDSQEKVAVQNGFGLIQEPGVYEIPIGSVIYHSSNGETRVFDGNGNQLLRIDDNNSTKINTTHGEISAAKILNVPNGVLIKSNGNITQIFRNDEPIFTVITEMESSPVLETTTFTSSWVEDAYVSLSNLGYFSAEWRIPSSPTVGSGIQDSLFNAIEPQQYGSGGKPSIIQPVLTYTNGWIGYVEYFDSYNNSYDTPKINGIAVGNLIQGGMSWDNPNNCWDIRFWDENTSQVEYNFSVMAPEITETNLIAHTTLEAYGTTSNANLPGTTTFSNIQLKDSSGNPLSVSWNTWINPSFQAFLTGLNVTSTSSSNVLNTGVTPTINAISPNHGTKTGGTTVTITGSGFTGATSVRFGGLPATSYTVNSNLQITADRTGPYSGDLRCNSH